MRVTQLYAAYRHWISSEKPFASVEDELATLSRQGEDFRQIIDPSVGDAQYNLARFIAVFDVGTVYPLLLAMADIGIDDNAWREVGIILESYLLRRDLCGSGTAGYNRLFLQLMRGLKRDSFSPEALRAALINQEETSFRWPDNTAFRNAWMNEPLYGRRSAGRIGHVLRRLNNSFVSSKTEEVVINSPLTIEHIMPVEWQTSWPMCDGSSGFTDQQLEETSEDSPTAQATLRRNKLIHTVGNLTLLSQALNSAQSNGCWSDKRSELLKHSLLPINLQLAQTPVWHEEAIQERGKMLFDHALAIWPR